MKIKEYHKPFELANFLDEDSCKTLVSAIKNLEIECPYHGQYFCEQHGSAAPLSSTTRSRESFLEFSPDCLLEACSENNGSEYFLMLCKILKQINVEANIFFKDDLTPLKFAIHSYKEYSQQKPHEDKYPYASILYLTDEYVGGELYFPNQKISFKPNHKSLYLFVGMDNPHGVSEIVSGERYTIVTFWGGEKETLNKDRSNK